MNITIARSIIETPEGIKINLTLKKGESWILIDQVLLDDKGVLWAASPSHQISIW